MDRDRHEDRGRDESRDRDMSRRAVPAGRGQTLAASRASRLWIMVQGAMPMATTLTVDEVLAREWSRTAWPRCLVMPKRSPLVRIQAPEDRQHVCVCVG